jgi:hypothetical protein
MGFAYCDFRHQGGGQQMLMARSVARPRSLHASDARSSDARAEVSASVATPAVESAKLEPVKQEAKPEPAKTESAPELRSSTD